LTFGYRFYIDDVLSEAEGYPSGAMKISTLLSTYTVEPSIYLHKGKTHKLEIWATLNDTTINRFIIIENVVPAQPYPSWTLISGEWRPPVPKPATKGIWAWDESAKKWNSLDNDYDIGTAGSATDTTS